MRKVKRKKITVTSKARAHLLELCERESALGFRLSVKTAGCSGFRYVPDLCFEVDANDQAFDFDGLKVFVPTDDMVYLEDAAIDLMVMSLGQTQLVYRNPNATNHCGCGESFSLKSKVANEN